jgi:hypothetical protein
MAHFLVHHRPIFAKHVPSEFGRQVQTIAKKSVSDRAISLWPIRIRQSFRHQRSKQPRPRYTIASVVPAHDENPLSRILHRLLETRIYLGIKPRIKVQSGSNHEGAKEFARCLASHRRPEAFSVCAPALLTAGWRIAGLRKSRPDNCPGDCVHRAAVVHKKLEFLAGRKWLPAGSYIGKHDRLLLQQIVQRGAGNFFDRSWRSRSGFCGRLLCRSLVRRLTRGWLTVRSLIVRALTDRRLTGAQRLSRRLTGQHNHKRRKNYR